MCIRDRVGTPVDDYPVGDACGFVGDFVEGNTVNDILELDPVSYTHLRAHETVLDLVCRLLLEKKKKHRQSRHR